jgi:pimeloyl-ACP methyl ester carboxylesterase
MLNRREFLSSTALGCFSLCTALRVGGDRAFAAFAPGLGVTDPVAPVPDEPFSMVLDPNSPGGLLTSDYQLPPVELIGALPQNPGETRFQYFERMSGRVKDWFLYFATTKDPRKILADATLLALGLKLPDYPEPCGRGGCPPLGWVPPDPRFALNFAQLAVTGRTAFNAFRAWNPKDADLISQVRQANPNLSLDEVALEQAAARVLDAAYTALWAIRANDRDWRAFRPKLGYIGVSGEDDLPHRPVNVPTATFPQYDLDINLYGHPITVRYMVASAAKDFGAVPAGGLPQSGVPGGKLRSIPSDVPGLAPVDEILIFIHGDGSRLEEAIPLARALFDAGTKKGKSYTVIAFDMLNSGYNTSWIDDNFDNSGSYHPSGDSSLSFDPTNPTYGYPLLDIEEGFVITVIEALDKQLGNIKSQIAAIMGGSLGGNMGMRLARRKEPYCRTIVAWSVTCMAPYISSPDQATVVGHLGGLIGKYTEKEDQPVGSRSRFFDDVYNQPLSAPLGFVLLPQQPQLWYRPGWEPGKSALIAQSRYDRYEYYNQEFRRWTYRQNYESTIFSFQEGDVYVPNKAKGPLRYLTVSSTLLLATGSADQWLSFVNSRQLYNVYADTLNVAKQMVNTPGTTLFIENTGHSIHSERPIFFAGKIVEFLTGINPASDRGFLPGVVSLTLPPS